MVYFIRRADGFIKIGTTACLTRRLAQLKAEHGPDLTVLAVIDGGPAREGGLHFRFSHLRADGEWFRPGDDILAFIESAGRAWDGRDAVRPVMLRADVVRMARVVARIEGANVTDLLSNLLDPILTEMGRAEIERREALEAYKDLG